LRKSIIRAWSAKVPPPISRQWGRPDAAHKALEQGDCLTTSGLAEKASVLTKALTPKAPPR
jgi:hypothetical protein